MTSTTRNPLSQAEAFARLRLLRSPGSGGATYLQLLARCGSAIEALAALPDLAARGGEAANGATRKRTQPTASVASVCPV